MGEIAKICMPMHLISTTLYDQNRKNVSHETETQVNALWTGSQRSLLVKPTVLCYNRSCPDHTFISKLYCCNLQHYESTASLDIR